MKKNLYILTDLIHTLQLERGYSAVYLYSKGTLFSEQMFAQFLRSNTIIDFCHKNLKKWKRNKDLNPSQYQKLEHLLTKCLNLPGYRVNSEKKNTSPSKCINYYSHQLIEPILQLMIEIALCLNKDTPSHVIAYNAFLHWKESIGLERAIVARGFIGHDFRNEAFKERVLFLLSEQDNYKNTYLALANNIQKKQIENALKTAENDELTKIHKLFKSSSNNDFFYTITVEDWFSIITKKINNLYQIEKNYWNLSIQK